MILTVLTVHTTCPVLQGDVSSLQWLSQPFELQYQRWLRSVHVNLGKEQLGKGRWGGKIFLNGSDSILLKRIWDDWGQGWQTMTGTFLGFVNEILSDDTVLIHLLMISSCFGARIAELRICSAELFPQRPYGPIGRPKIFVLCSFTESACWNFFWDLKVKVTRKEECEKWWGWILVTIFI